MLLRACLPRLGRNRPALWGKWRRRLLRNSRVISALRAWVTFTKQAVLMARACCWKKTQDHGAVVVGDGDGFGRVGQDEFTRVEGVAAFEKSTSDQSPPEPTGASTLMVVPRVRSMLGPWTLDKVSGRQTRRWRVA